MARTSSRRWKGCPQCKYYKYAEQGQSIRQPWSTLRKIGKDRRVTRHDLGDQDR